MTTGLRWTFSVLFILLLPITLLLLIPKLNGFGPGPLTESLRQQKSYEQLSTLLYQAPTPTGSDAEITDQAFAVLRSAMTPSYLEKKGNVLIHGTSDWMTNASQNEPEVSFNDIKEQVTNFYPDAQVQINQLQEQLKQAKEELKNNPMPVDGIEGFEANGSTSPDEIAKLLEQTNSLDNFIAGDFRFSLGQTLQPLKTLYQLYSLALPVLGLLLILCAGLMMALTKGWHSRMRWAGWVLIIASLANMLLALIFTTVILGWGMDTVVRKIPGQAEVAGSLAQAAANALFKDYFRLELTLSGILLIIGILLVIAATFLRKRQSSELDGSTSNIQASRTTLVASPSATQPANNTPLIK